MIDFAPKLVLRDGLPVEKGIELITDFLDANEELIEKYLNFWMLYPDCFLDVIKPQNSPIHLFFYQRICLRESISFFTSSPLRIFFFMRKLISQ